ncbi:MAG TPA: ATP-binding protein [Candidatus Acidoferrales bacterium]|nr:ATP-binding protein [Candidatus Acidoferrales bacterium]
MLEHKTSAPSDLYRELVESIKDYAVFLLDAEGCVVTWNAGAQRIKGYTADEIVGRSFEIFYPEEERERGKPKRVLAAAADTGRYEEEGWRVRKDGSRFWANVVITPRRGADGRLRGFAKVTRDLTHSKELDDQRRTLEAITEEALAYFDIDELFGAILGRVRDALHADTIAVLLLDPVENVLVARAAKGIEEEVERGVRIPVGRGFAGRVAAEGRPVILPDVDHADVLNPILREKGIRSLLGVPLRLAGRVTGVLHVGSLHPRDFSQSEARFLQIVADRLALAVEHARLFEAVRLARHEANVAEEALRARDEFLSVAAHELKTPITSAKVAAQLLRRSFRGAALDPLQERSIDTIERQIGKLSRLVTQLLDTVRIQSGGLVLQVEETDLPKLLRDVAEEARALSDRHTIVVNAPEELRARVDALRLEQVVRNLLDNAVKFMPDGGQIDVDLVRSPSTAIITVRDRGLGVPVEHLPRLFDRFYQAHPNRSGMGLGLYVSRQIVDRHGGTIYAETPDDGGTRFVISLPLEAQLVALGAKSA